MSLKRSVFLAVMAAVLAATLLEGVLDVGLEALGAAWVGGDEGSSARLLVDLLDVPLFALLGLALAHWLSRRIARPLNRLTDANRQLAAAGRAEELNVPPGGDELSELVASFNAMARSVDEHVERERAFTRYASHELRTPLSAMLLQLEAARMGHKAAEATLPVLEKNVRRMEEVLGALLALARSGDGPVDKAPLMPLLRESISAMPEGNRHRVQLLGSLEETYVSHPRLVQQAVENLVENALLHGGGRAKVEVGTAAGALYVRVVDEGPGVPADSLARLTEPFFRVDPASEGMGLGLAFVSHVARALGGELVLSSEHGGMAATLTLPRAAPV